MLMRPADSPHAPLQQSRLYAELLTALGRETALIETGVGRLLTVRRGPVSYAARGPVWTLSDAEARVDFLRRHGPLILVDENSGPDVLRAAGYRPLLAGTEHAILTLDGDLLGRAHGKWRHAAKQGQHAGLDLQIRPFELGRDLPLLLAERKQRRAKGYRGYPSAFTQALAMTDPDAVLTLSAMKDGERIAGLIFLVHGTGATYHLGWTSAEGRRLCAHHAGLVLAARALAAQGVKTLDLGRIDRQEAPGLARFKLRTGARAVVLGGTWWRLPAWRR